MASRRFATSALRALSTASSIAVRPATVTAAARIHTAASPSHIRRRNLVFGQPAAVLRRSYSYSKDDVVPNSRLWNFEELKTLVERNSEEEGKKIVIVDVREPVELFETGKIPGAINIPITSAVQSFHLSEEDFEELYGFDRPPKDAELLFYCKAGVRARAAAALAQSAGWESVGEYPGSWLDWAKQNGPVEKVEQK
ncbi:Rhodanese-like domain-containing protein [Mariannaea sp. PMI_226]|nr:Rhodanese-like domain-containing protein [Mariannaea sp. PMI_226]